MSAAVIEDNKICSVCSQPKYMHKNFIHEFAQEGQPLIVAESTGDSQSSDDASSQIPVTQGRIRMPIAGDPIMRMLLIRKGLITVEDLDTIEAELRATGVLGYEPPKALG